MAFINKAPTSILSICIYIYTTFTKFLPKFQYGFYMIESHQDGSHLSVYTCGHFILKPFVTWLLTNAYNFWQIISSKIDQGFCLIYTYQDRG